MIRRFYGLELQLGVCGDDVPMGTVKEVSNAKSTMYYAKDYFDSTITVARFKCLDDGRWRIATDLEKDLYGWNPENTKDGTLLEGPFTGRKLVWDADTLRYADDSEVSWNRGCVSYTRDSSFVLENQLSHYICSQEGWIFDKEGSSGTMQDAAGTEYRTVAIGTQRWMAENLNYAIWDSDCFECETYGRLYTWSSAKWVCPEGWHLPTLEEWNTLFAAVGGATSAGAVLKSASGWTSTWQGNSGGGTDAFGFTVLPAGLWAGSHANKGKSAFFWTATEGEDLGKSGAFDVSFDYEQPEASSKVVVYLDDHYMSVRCIENQEELP